MVNVRLLSYCVCLRAKPGGQLGCDFCVLIRDRQEALSVLYSFASTANSQVHLIAESRRVTARQHQFVHDIEA